MASCAVPDCTNPPTLQWQRWATDSELASLREQGEIGPGDTECRLPIYGCDAHKIDGQLAVDTHDATCTAPPTCDCSVSE